MLVVVTLIIITRIVKAKVGIILFLLWEEFSPGYSPASAIVHVIILIDCHKSLDDHTTQSSLIHTETPLQRLLTCWHQKCTECLLMIQVLSGIFSVVNAPITITEWKVGKGQSNVSEAIETIALIIVITGKPVWLDLIKEGKIDNNSVMDLF